MKKTKKIIIGIAIVLGIILIQLLSYKFALIQLSRPGKGEGYKTFENIGETITIETQVTGETKSYLNINYPVFDGDYEFYKERSNNRYSTYYLSSDDEAETFLSSIKVGTAYTYYDQIIKNNDGNIVKSNKRLFDIFDINNNFDIINYIIEHYNDKVNIFTSSDKIKMRNLINTYTNQNINKGKLVYIDGDLEGFMLVSEEQLSIDVNLKHGDELYYFSFLNSEGGKYYNEEKVIEFLRGITYKN